MSHFGEWNRTSVGLLIGAWLLSLMIFPTDAIAQTTVFTYQGKLADSGAPANGPYDFTMTLWDALTNGAQIGSTSTLLNTPVVDGIFTVTLDFGAGSFNGGSRFLEIGVKLSGAPLINPTLLTPRQQILSTPYAIKSLGSMSADSLSVACVNCITSNQIGSVNGSAIVGSINGSAISGVIPVASVPGGSTSYIQNTTTTQASSNFKISGDGTAGGTLTGNVINSATQYNLGGIRIISNPGNNNFFVGASAGLANSTGSSNSFFGSNAGAANTQGNGNSFIGSSAGDSNTTGSLNAFFGTNAGQANTIGSNNSFFGNNAGFTSTGNNNSFFGSSAGRNNSGGFNNSFFGKEAGFSNNSAHDNSFFGYSAGFATTGNENSFFGSLAGGSTNTGSLNSFFGSSAGQDNASGNENSFFGRRAGEKNTSSFNSFFGSSAGRNNLAGFNNSFFGQEAGLNNTSGNFNSFFGGSAGTNNTTGNDNAFFGVNTGFFNDTGNFNAFFGRGAGGGNVHGSNNTLIGGAASVGTDNLTNAIAIGYRALVSQSNSLVLGSIAGINGAAADTKVGIGTTTPSERLTIKTATDNYGFIHTDGTITIGSFVGGAANGGYIGTKSNHPLHFFTNNGSAAFTLETSGFLRLNNVDAGGSLSLCLGPSNHISFCSSSLRYKTDVQTFTGGLNIINRLRPIAFTWKEGGMRDLGFGAEEVEKVEPRLTFRNNEGQIEGVRYSQISAVLVNAINEQQAQIEQHRIQNASLQEQLNQQQSEIERLKRLVYRQISKAAPRKASLRRPSR